MKKYIIGASVLAVFLMAGAAYATNLNSSKSNATKEVATAADEKACTDAGGTIVTLRGKKYCQPKTERQIEAACDSDNALACEVGQDKVCRNGKWVCIGPAKPN